MVQVTFTCDKASAAVPAYTFPQLLIFFKKEESLLVAAFIPAKVSSVGL